eukprot:2774834-Rhodomonas_salina.2
MPGLHHSWPPADARGVRCAALTSRVVRPGLVALRAKRARESVLRPGGFARTVLRAGCAVCGTESGGAAARRRTTRGAPRRKCGRRACLDELVPPPLSSSAPATRCAVLTWRVLLPGGELGGWSGHGAG